MVEEFRAALDGAGEALRAVRADGPRDWMWSEIVDSLLDRLRADSEAARRPWSFEAEVRAGRLPPTAAVEQVLRVFLGGSSPV